MQDNFESESSKAKLTLQRQKSMPQMKPVSKNRTTGHRSKTPPPKPHHNIKSVPATCVSGRTVPGKNFTQSIDDLHNVNVRSAPKSKKINRTLSKGEILDIKYNEYVQISLAIAHSTEVRKYQEVRVLKELKQLQNKLALMEEKIIELDVDIQKIEYLKEVKRELLQKIKEYENLNDIIDVTQTDKWIRVLEHDLNKIQICSFEMPHTKMEAKEVLKHLNDICNDLESWRDLEKKILPLVQLHASLINTRKNVQKEEEKKLECEFKLKEAEELVYQECYLKSLEDTR